MVGGRPRRGETVEDDEVSLARLLGLFTIGDVARDDGDPGRPPRSQMGSTTGLPPAVRPSSTRRGPPRRRTSVKRSRRNPTTSGDITSQTLAPTMSATPVPPSIFA